MMDPTMNLIRKTHHSCERRKYAFMILREYTIISRDVEETLILITLGLKLLPISDRMIRF